MSAQTTIELTTADGHTLAADLAVPDGAARGAVVVCHPHPLYGGDRHNPIVDAVFRALAAAGFRVVRFDFRAEHGGGVAEVADVAAAIDAVTPGDSPAQPVFVVGYSFGARVALDTADARIAAIVAIAAPLGTPLATPPDVPVLVLAPRHDQYSPPEMVAVAVAGWPDGEIDIVESADHFLAGHVADVARRTVDWLSARTALTV